MFNEIRTNEGYMAKGFSAEECPMIRRHDILFNKYQSGEATDAEREEMFDLAEKLGL